MVVHNAKNFFLVGKKIPGLAPNLYHVAVFIDPGADAKSCIIFPTIIIEPNVDPTSVSAAKNAAVVQQENILQCVFRYFKVTQ